MVSGKKSAAKLRPISGKTVTNVKATTADQKFRRGSCVKTQIQPRAKTDKKQYTQMVPNRAFLEGVNEELAFTI